MVFSSLEFIFLFLPITLILYFALPRTWRNLTLLMLSLAFYAWGEPRFLPLMLITVTADFLFGLMVGRSKHKRVWLTVAVAFNLALLGFFKYFDLFLSLFGIAGLGLGLPIGISFYTFQALSYVIDVYRGDARAQRSPISFGTYVTLFPQLIAGPIVRYCELDRQLSEREHSLTLAASGARTFIVGLCKKVLLGNTAGAMWVAVRDLPPDSRSAILAWFGIICFTAQIYFDFSGYSDMAIGLGKLFGFRFPENFNYPYVARSVTEFWRRWHITLSTWFREYLYIPLGGNRCGRARTYLNLFLVWAATGLWHGASLNFLAWGVYYFVLLCLEKAFWLRTLEKLPSPISWCYTFLTVVFGWLIFVFDGSTATLTLSSGLTYLGNMFGSSGLFRPSDAYTVGRNLVPLIIMAVASTPWPRRLFYKLYRRYAALDWLAVGLCAVGVVLGTAYLVSSSYNPFLYFRF